MSRVTMEAVRAKYPEPVRAEHDSGSGTCYCVGGALGLYLNELYDSFPEDQDLMEYLMKANPDLPPGEASRAACRIIDLNDAGQFERAWWELDEALTWDG